MVSKVVAWLFLILVPGLASGVLAARLPKAYDSSKLEEHVTPHETRYGGIHPLDGRISENASILYAAYIASGGPFQGVKTSIYVWPLETLQAGQTSAAEIFIANLDDSNRVNMIEAGWHVMPQLYNDGATHLFTSWTSDNYQSTGCFNLDCPGFIRSSPKISPGDQLPFSIYDGQQKQITLQISKHPDTGDWLLQYGDGGSLSTIGYWPSSLFTTLADNATNIGLGGIGTYEPGQATPPMGSGHFASEGFKRAASFDQIQVVNENYLPVDPVPSDWASALSKTACYSLENFEDRGGNYGYSFYFGGPGNC